MPIENTVNAKQATPATSRNSRELIQIPLDNLTENEPMHPQGNPTVCLESHQNVQSRTGVRSSQCSILAKSSVWRRGWKTLLPIVGFYVLAWICAIAHYSVFTYFNGRIIYQELTPLAFKFTRVPQTYVTTISLVLVTAFRAALIACIGSCYTQYLWKELRSQLLEVGLIEEMFRIRSNPFRLLNKHLVRNTPILVLVAGFSWLVPVATIYPPGALIVNLDIRKVDAVFNVSVFQPDSTYSPTDLPADTPIRIPELDPLIWGVNGLALVALEHGRDEPVELVCNATTFCEYQSPRSSLKYLATTVMMTGEIASMNSPRGVNESYTLTFRGPVLQCNQTTITNETELQAEYYPTTRSVGLSAYSEGLPMSEFTMRPSDSKLSLFSRTGSKYLDYFPCLDPKDYHYGSNSWTVNVTLLQQLEKLECFPGTALYNVNITYNNGNQSVDYSVTDKELLPSPLPGFSKEFYSNQHMERRTLRSFEEYMNILALIDSSLDHLEYEGTIKLLDFSSSAKVSRLPNGTTSEVCLVETYTSDEVPDKSILRYSNFNSANRDSSSVYYQNLTVTESLLNSLLANVTISALSLDTWYDLVKGTENIPFKIYRFENKLNFFLPYGISLFLAIPIIGIGLLAIRNNGVTAIDGGFLQILMTTTGRTKLEEAAVQGCFGGEESIPSELKKLKVRFGELIVDEKTLAGEEIASVEAETIANAPRGTLDEVIPLEQLELGEEYARSVVSNSELLECSRTENRVGSDGMGEYVEVASGADECLSESHVVRRVAFGTSDETKPLKKGVQYGW